MSTVVRKNKETFKVKVISNDEISDGVFILETEKTANFLPGQVVAVAMHPDDNLRLYSLASGPEAPVFRILYDIKPLGQLTPVMANLKSGEYIYISKPFGRFTDQGQAAWWIATGTGIAPFVSMMEAGQSANKMLLHGARYINQFYFSDAFEKNMGNRYLRFSTKESGDNVIHGRLTHFLKETDKASPDLKYYICGSAEMVVEARDILIGKGVPFDHIIAEIYF
jgi:ferredoxin-NADP reductase